MLVWSGLRRARLTQREKEWGRCGVGRDGVGDGDLILNFPMSYAAAIEQLSTMTPELYAKAGQARRKFSLDEVRILLAALGDPQRRFPEVLIAGTNGKGSTAATLASILTEAGLRTGLYTSPHLERPNERIRVGRAEIADGDFARLFFGSQIRAIDW